jgi:hypothetical protein
MRIPIAGTLLSLLALTHAQAVTNIVVPESEPPEGCQNSRVGTFTITIQNVTNPTESTSAVASTTFAKRYEVPAIKPLHLLPRQAAGILTMTLNGGVLVDQANRTGYIASNYQFQFDAPPQAGAIYTGGFSLCSNGSLALGGSAIFYQCLSGTFYNLYDRNWAEHCNAVYILAIGGAGQVFSTQPPEPVSTGPSEATIANGGGTQSMNSTTGVGIGGGSTSATATGSGSGSGEATATGTGGEASATGEGAGEASSSSSDGLAVPTGVSGAQKALGWAAGLVGALALV